MISIDVTTNKWDDANKVEWRKNVHIEDIKYIDRDLFLLFLLFLPLTACYIDACKRSKRNIGPFGITQ